MAIVKIDPNDKYPRIYWPEDLRHYGYSGEVELICDPFTATILHPNATPEQIIGSLENRIRDIQLRKASAKQAGFRPLQEPAAKTPVVKAPEAEWESMQCPYPDCGAPLMWNVKWDQAVCSRCGRPIVRYGIQSSAK